MVCSIWGTTGWDVPFTARQFVEQALSPGSGSYGESRRTAGGCSPCIFWPIEHQFRFNVNTISGPM